MNRLVASLSVALITLSACRTYIPYVATPISDPAQARRVMQQTLEEQRDENAPVHVEVTNERFRVVRSREEDADEGDLYGTSVYYTRITDILLSERKGVYAVSIFGLDEALLIHVFAYDQETAERFIDALGTMRSRRNLKR